MSLMMLCGRGADSGPENLIVNGDFEVDISPWFATADAEELSHETGDAHGGTGYLQVSTVGGDPGEGAFSDWIAEGVNDGDELAVSLWARGSGSIEFVAFYRWPTGTFDNSAGDGPESIPLTGSWTQFEHTWTVTGMGPGTVTNADVAISIQTATGDAAVFDIDDVILTRVP